MSSTLDQRTSETQAELDEAGLPGVTAEFDDTNICYLTGEVATSDDEAAAVAIAQAHGATSVCDGVEAPQQAIPELERYHIAGAQQHHENAGKTPGEVILGGADLSGRLFDSTRASLQTGTPVVTK
jgi:hypothetical protein